MKEKHRVTVGNVTVGFIFESMDRRGGDDSTGGVAAAFGPTTKAKSVLAGVDNATMQAITDAAYAAFDPVAVEGDFAAREDTTKGGGMQKTANVAGGVMNAFGMRGFGVGKSKTFTFTAKSEFRDGAIKAAELANGRLADQLAALKWA